MPPKNGPKLLSAAAVRRAMGRRIAELRRGLAWTQQDFADRMGVSVSYVRRLESGSENLALSGIVDIANVLGVGLDAMIAEPESTVVRRGRPPKSTA